MSLGPRRVTRSQTRRAPDHQDTSMANIEQQLNAILEKLESVNSRLDAQEKSIGELKEKRTQEKPLESDGEEEDDAETPLPPPKTETEKRVEQLEELVKRMSENSVQGPRVADYEIKGQLPKKFVITDLPKFKGTEDPEDHLRTFNISMVLKGMSKELFTSVFPITLDTHPSRWFKTLNQAKLDDWEYIKHEFLKQYRYNSQLPVGLRELEATKQGERENFSTFLNRWREKAAQMTNRPNEEDQVRMVIKNLQPKYREPLKFQPIDSFTGLYKVGLLVEEDVQAQKSKGNGGGFNKKGGSSFSNTDQVSHITNDNSSNHPGSFNNRPRGPPRTFLPIGMTYEQAFDRLTAKGALAPIGPTPDPSDDKKSRNWNPNAYCKFHQGRGHTTENCIVLKHRIQDMVEDGRLPVPPAAKDKINIHTSPLAKP